MVYAKIKSDTAGEAFSRASNFSSIWLARRSENDRRHGLFPAKKVNIYLPITVRLTLKFRVGEFRKSTLHL